MVTKKQKEILLLMNDGWELGIYTMDNSYTLQQGGLGRGGKVLNGVRFKSIDSLHKAGYISVVKTGFPVIRTYAITEKGKQFLQGGG